jgi:hypothetical protein
MTDRPPLPPFDRESALTKVQAAEDAWNTRGRGSFGHGHRDRPARALSPADRKPAVLEHAQVLGYRRAADRQLPRQLTDRARAPGEQLEDRPPRRVAEQAEPAFSVSIH